MPRPHPALRRGDLALVAAAICFGSTFLVVQDAVERVEPIPFLAVRFLIGAAALWPLARRQPASPGELRDGFLAGLALVAGYVLQTIGLQYTGSATSAFITYLLVVFVPVLGLVLLRRRPHPVTVVGIAIAAAPSPSASRRRRAASSGSTRRIHPSSRSGETAAAGPGAAAPGGRGGS